MFLMYVDESGDVGMSAQSPTRYFVLTGIVVHELRWQTSLDQILSFRQRMKSSFGLRMRDETHAAQMITSPGALVHIQKQDRLSILRFYCDELVSMNDLNIINIVVDKQGKPANYDVFEMAWKCLIMRLEKTLAANNFNGPRNADERAMLFPDHTDDKKLTQLLRKMRHYNPTPFPGNSGWINKPLRTIIEDPNFRESHDSHFIQAADVCAFMLYQHLAPSAYMRKKGANVYFERLEPVLCKVAAPKDRWGIVRL